MSKTAVIGQQLDFAGKVHPTAGANVLRNQLISIMETIPETVDDDDLLAALWLHDFGGFTKEKIHKLLEPPHGSPIKLLEAIYQRQRRVDIRRRRQGLRHHYPYSQEEEARRQKAARQRGRV